MRACVCVCVRACEGGREGARAVLRGPWRWGHLALLCSRKAKKEKRTHASLGPSPPASSSSNSPMASLGKEPAQPPQEAAGVRSGRHSSRERERDRGKPRLPLSVFRVELGLARPSPLAQMPPPPPLTRKRRRPPAAAKPTAKAARIDTQPQTPPPPPDAAALEALTLALLARRAPGATACPSEVARAACRAGMHGRDAWRAWMPAVRVVAAGLAGRGLVAITQRGVGVGAGLVESGEVRGPIRLALVRGGGDGEGEK